MEEKLQVSVSVEKDGQRFTFLMPYGFKYGSAYDALFDVLELVSKRAQEQIDKAKKELEKRQQEAAKAEAQPQPIVEAVQEKK